MLVVAGLLAAIAGKVSAVTVVSFISRQRAGGSSRDTLRSLPYLTWVKAGDNLRESGVTRYDPEKAFKGLNLYTPGNLSTAYLMNIEGKTLHTWSADAGGDTNWHHVELADNGDLLAIVKDRMLIRLGRDSTVKWVTELRAHHDPALVNARRQLILNI